MAAALAGKTIPEQTARQLLAAVRQGPVEQPQLAAAIVTAGKLPAGPRQFSPDDVRQILAEAADQGSAERGETIFRRADLGCLKCHAIGGAGGSVGPDLASLGASAQPDYILQSILKPGAKIKENYEAQLIATDDGHVYSGIKVKQTADSFTLRDAEDRLVTIRLHRSKSTSRAAR